MSKEKKLKIIIEPPLKKGDMGLIEKLAFFN